MIGVKSTPVSSRKSWNVYVDGLSTKGRSGVELIIKMPRSDRQEHTLNFQLKASNGKAGYEAVIIVVELDYMANIEEVHAFLES